MTPLAEVDALIREAERRHACEMRRLLAVRATVARALPVPDADPDWLSLDEIAALPTDRDLAVINPGDLYSNGGALCLAAQEG